MSCCRSALIHGGFSLHEALTALVVIHVGTNAAAEEGDQLWCFVENSIDNMIYAIGHFV